jgi:hypothetical protein
MKKILLFFLSALFVSCGTKQVLTKNGTQVANCCSYGTEVDLTSRYVLDYDMNLYFPDNKIQSCYSRAKIIDKVEHDTVEVKMENLKCAIINNPPVIFAGVFEITHQDQHYIVHFLCDDRTIMNKKKGKMEYTVKCYNVEDLEPEILKRYAKP